MKKLDSKSLFEIFDQGDHDIYTQYDIVGDVDNTFIIFGSVIMGVSNFSLIDQIYSNRYQNHYNNVRQSVQLKYFTTLAKSLHRLGDIPPDTVNSLIDEFKLPTINYALNEMLEVFEQVEQYEQCIIIAKYLQLFSKKVVN